MPWRTTIPPKPAYILFAPLEGNRHRLEEWILDHSGASAFNTCLHQQLQTMKEKNLDIIFIPGTKPTVVHTPILVPHQGNKRVKLDIDRDVALGITEPVPVDMPTTWSSRITVTSKNMVHVWYTCRSSMPSL